MRHRPPVGAALVAAALVVLAAACGVQPDASPRPLARSDVPYGLLEAGPNTSTTVTTTPVPKVGSQVFFVAGTRLQPATRQVVDPPTVRRVLDALLAPPSESEVAAGLRSAIPPATTLGYSKSPNNVISVDLSPEFSRTSTPEQVLALAQIVFTLTEIPDVAGVQFTLNGSPVEVPTPAGSTTGPVNRDAFPNIAPAPPPANPAQ